MLHTKADNILSQAGTLWSKAVAALSEEERRILHTNEPPRQVVKNLLHTVEEEKQLCLEKRWKYRKDGQDIILRDKLEKIMMWVSKFVAVGDVAIQYEPLHAALPWAAVRFLLQASPIAPATEKRISD